MEYRALESFPYYNESKLLVEGLGYSLVELRVTPQNGRHQVRAVITRLRSEDTQSIGIDDCAKVHRLLLPRLEALIQSPEVYIEVTSPGLERLIKNAAEFSLFIGKQLRVWDVEISDWLLGIIRSANEKELELEIRDGNQKKIPFENITKAKLFQS